MIPLTLTIITFTIVKISRISRLDVVCTKSYACVTPEIDLINIVEKHNTLININCAVVEDLHIAHCAKRALETRKPVCYRVLEHIT